MVKKNEPEWYMEDYDIALARGIGKHLAMFKDKKTPVLSKAFSKVWNDAKTFCEIHDDVPPRVLSRLLNVNSSTIYHWRESAER